MSQDFRPLLYLVKNSTSLYEQATGEYIHETKTLQPNIKSFSKPLKPVRKEPK